MSWSPRPLTAGVRFGVMVLRSPEDLARLIDSYSLSGHVRVVEKERRDREASESAADDMGALLLNNVGR
jgi:hypothetical protein